MTPNPIRCLNEWHGDNASYYHGDCVDVIRQMPDNSVDLMVYSPPFSSVYTYSGATRDFGNVDTDAEFIEQYRHLARELFRVLRPGRLCCVHTKDLVYYRSGSETGTAGLRDFAGDILRAHRAEGFDLHSHVTIKTDPVLEMQKTKAHGLLYKQLRADSTMSRQGCAERMVILRKWPRNEAEESMRVKVSHTPEDFTLDQWQEWASPVWTSVDPTDVLNVRQSRENSDERHMCPLSRSVTERCVKLWSNPGEVVLSPFGGIASEGVYALEYGRKYVGIELKESYWNTGVRNLAEVDRPMQSVLFVQSPHSAPLFTDVTTADVDSDVVDSP